MTVTDLVRLARGLADLGWAVAEQVEDVAAGGDLADCNPAALRAVREWLDAVDAVADPDGELAGDVSALAVDIDDHLGVRR